MSRLPEASPLLRRPRVVAVATVFGGAVLLFTGFLVGQGTGDAPARLPEASPAGVPTASEEGPRTVADGVPLGYTRTEAGAVAAAVTFAEVVTGLADTPDAHIAAARTIATNEWRPRSVELARNTINFLSESYPGAAISFTPVRYDIVEYGQDSATVKVWGVTLVYPPDRQPEQTWATGTFRLAWVGDWRMDGGGSSGGPTPSLLKMSDEVDWRVINGFSDVDVALRS